MSETRQDFIEVSNASLKYTKWEGGDKCLLCFHGFGQDGSAYKVVSDAIKNRFTVYSFDIFFHGESVWDRKVESLYPHDWFEFMRDFFQKEAIDRFEVMGFSMGGKFAMITAQLFPEQVEHIHLLAPDGISTHFSYRFSTYPLLFRKLFKTQIKNPWVFKGLVKFCGTFKLIDGYTLRFAQTQMDTEFKRAQVYYSWVVFRHFIPDPNMLAGLINNTNMQLSFYLGKHDKVINRKEIGPLTEKLKSPDIREIESGHTKLIEALAEYLATSETQSN